MVEEEGGEARGSGNTRLDCTRLEAVRWDSVMEFVTVALRGGIHPSTQVIQPRLCPANPIHLRPGARRLQIASAETDADAGACRQTRSSYRG